MKKVLLSLLCLLSISVPFGAQAQLISTGKAGKFIEADVKVLLGGSFVSQNYKSCFHEITDVNNSMGFAWGLGIGARLNINSFIGIGTELNYIFNSGSLDIAVANEQATNVSNVFVKNHYRAFNIPVFVSFNFNVMQGLKWNVDAGLFLNFGTGGSRNANIYNSEINELGQIMMTHTHSKAHYYKDNKAFINSFRDFDDGLHLASGLTINENYLVGVRMQYGLRNVALSTGIRNPSCHNFNIFATLGYRF